METELIRIKTNEKNEHLVSARELHEKLESKERFSKWFGRMLKYGFIENQDFICVHFSTVVNNGAEREIGDYALKLDMAKEICMIQRSEIGQKYRQYFIECEKKLKQSVPALPQTYLEALKALVKSEEEKQQALLEAKEAKDHVKLLVHNGKTYTSSEIAKELGMKSAIALNKLLEEKRIQYKQNGTWLMYSEYSEKGYTSVKQIQLDNGTIQYDRRWTGKGRDFIINLLKTK